MCNEAIDRGTCTEHELRYFYDSIAGVCKAFEYSGCGGNNNRFTTMSACEARCVDADRADQSGM